MAAQVQVNWRFTVTEDGQSQTYSPQLTIPPVAISGGPFQARRYTIPMLVDGDPFPDPTEIWSYLTVPTPALIVCQWKGGDGFGLLSLQSDIPTSDSDITPNGTALNESVVPLAGHAPFVLTSVLTKTIATASTRVGVDGDGFPNLLGDTVVDARLYRIMARNLSYEADATLEVWIVE